MPRPLRGTPPVTVLLIDRFPHGHSGCGSTGSSAVKQMRDSVVMTGVDCSADLGARPERRWDVALSFAGAQRDYVRQVAEALKARRVRCFYDADEQVRLWGTYLAEELPRIYARESAAVVVFVSADYAAGDWTRLERRAAFGRAVAEAGVYVLPARFDDSELPGLLPDVVDVDLRDLAPGQFADLVVAKLADLAISPSPVPGGGGREPAGGMSAGEVGRDRRRRVSKPAMAALIGAVGVIVAASIAIAASLGGHPGGPPVPDPVSNSPSVSASPSGHPTVSRTAPPSTGPPGKLHKELTDNHLGTPVFSDPMGDAVTGGPERIPYGTQVLVKCWAPNESGMGSINAFYLVETRPWAGEYAPANTFLNADTAGTLDPDVPKCPAT
jgi:hypothetical protein